MLFLNAGRRISLALNSVGEDVWILTADASSDHEHEISCYGVILEGPHNNILSAQGQVAYSKNIEDIEAAALEAGVRIAENQKIPLGKIVACTDSTTFFNSLEKPNRKANNRLRKYLSKVRRAMKEGLEVRHVARHIVHRAHILARAHMDEIRTQSNSSVE